MKRLLLRSFAAAMSVFVFFTVGCNNGDTDGAGAGRTPAVEGETTDDSNAGSTAAGWSDNDLIPVDETNTSQTLSKAYEIAAIADMAIMGGIGAPSTTEALSAETLKNISEFETPRTMASMGESSGTKTVEKLIDKVYPCPGGGSLSVNGTRSFEKSRTDRTNGSFTGSADIKFVYDACVTSRRPSKALTAFGEGSYKAQSSYEISSSGTTVIWGVSLPNVVVLKSDFDSAYKSDLAFEDADGDKYDIDYFYDYKYTLDSSSDYTAYYKTWKFADIKVSGTAALDAAYGLNDYRCTQKGSWDLSTDIPKWPEPTCE